MICRAANALWLASCLPEAASFRRALRRVREEQESLLRAVLRRNAESSFGRRYAFASIDSAREYRRRVPLHTYEDYRNAIERVAEGAPNVLTREPVRLLEPTSGSTGATKLVPYTASLQREFQRGIKPWIADLFRRDPGLLGGQAYWSVSPAATGNRRSRGGIPIGFEDDASYVGTWQRRLVGAVMAVPSAVRHIADVDAFRYATVRALVESANLRLVSVWNPTFLTLLVERLPELGDALARDPHVSSPRRSVLQAALRAPTPAERNAMLWPELRVISCWTDGRAAAAASHVAALFPQARIQGKGLIATEAFVSLPLAGCDGAALAMRSHFFEFAPLDGDQRPSDRTPCLAHELESGRRYSVIVSTGGGLYRYQLQDVVEVVGHVDQCPLIRFVGRQGIVSDQVGEKLTDAFVADVLREVLNDSRVSSAFAMLACDPTLPTPAYVLYMEAGAGGWGLDDTLAAAVDSRLRASFHYDYARRLGQLGPVRIFRAAHAAATYLATAVAAGQRAGDVKPLALSTRTDWGRVFKGSC